MLSVLGTYRGDPNSKYILITQSGMQHTGFIIFGDRQPLEKAREGYLNRGTRAMVCKNTPKKLEEAKRWSNRVHFA